MLTRKDFMGNHEWCFYGWREGAAHQFLGPVRIDDLPGDQLGQSTSTRISIDRDAAGYGSVECASAAPADEPRQVLNLLDALKASVEQAVSQDTPVNGTARDALTAQLSRPRGRRKAAVAKSERKTTKKSASRRPRKKSA